MWAKTKTLQPTADHKGIVKVDPAWGFSEFPAPGDTKKHLLPVLIDPEEAARKVEDVEEKSQGKQLKQFWMPDKFCKVCYACEEPFTMYRRRHHCRMCGQVFCNNCSSYAIEGSLFNVQGLVRACQVCYEQANEAVSTEAKLAKRRPVEKTVVEIQNAQIRELNVEYKHANNNLQKRASNHLSEIVNRLIESSHVIMKDQKVWKEIVVNLVNTVVSSVDPDVRSGDNLDIRPYVKIKVIPGGTINECVYVDGVVFRKNVSHKKMAAEGIKSDPKILLLAGGIEFQRTEARLASMDTLIEQEDKFMEILVEKIMSLKPDIILVGKAVARKAQELLCGHRVIVMQNVKQTILERVARMTGALLVPSTDSMVKQYGEECLGTCGKFWLRLVQDDPERSNEVQSARILRTRISRASTYAYVEGCPSDRGCTIVLRGGKRALLAEIKRIMRFAILVAYHLRLEVAYYNDRFADLPEELDDNIYDDSSDIDDEIIDGDIDPKTIEDAPTLASFLDVYPNVKYRKERFYVSTSIDIDFNIPYRTELIGTSLFRSKHLTKFQIESHQSLLITSLLMFEPSNSGPIQKTPADIKGIKYYTRHDVSLGAFIIENCFQLTRTGMQRESRMLDQTLSFAHKSGRIDITVKKVDAKAAAPSTAIVTSDREDLSGVAAITKDPLHLPLYISSYCRECGRIVTPQHILSEEVWKMSFGKFLELMFYNRSAKCTIGNCNHSLRDCHLLKFTHENYVATFEFHPIHPYALHVRDGMAFPEDFYWRQTLTVLNSLPERHSILLEDFRLAINVLEREVHDILASRPDDLTLALADVQLMTKELQEVSIKFYEELLHTFESLPLRYKDKEAETRIRNILNDRMQKVAKGDRVLTMPFTSDIVQSTPSFSAKPFSATGTTATSEGNVITTTIADSSGTVIPPEAAAATETIHTVDEVINEEEKTSPHHHPNEEKYPTEYNSSIAAIFPMIHYRDTFLKARRWNTRIDTIYKFLESVRNMLIQQLQAKEQSLAERANPTSHVVGGLVSSMYANAEAEELDNDYQSQKKHLTDVVLADFGKNPLPTPPPPPHVVATASSNDLPQAAVTVPLSREDDSSAVVTSVKEAPRSSVDGPSANAISVATAVPVGEAASASTAQSGMNTLYRAALEQNRRTSDRPVDKMSRITKALQRFLVGNKDAAGEQSKFFVPLNEFALGRYGLKPGRNGVVVPVSEEVLASIIAYTLASNEYYEGLQASIREDHSYHPEFENFQDLETNTGASAGMTEEEKKLLESEFSSEHRGRSKTLQGQQFPSDQSDETSHTNASSDVFSLGNTIMGPFKRRETRAISNNEMNLDSVPEGDREDIDEEEEDFGEMDKSPTITSPRNRTLTRNYSLMKNFHEDSSTRSDNNPNLLAFGPSNNLFSSTRIINTSGLEVSLPMNDASVRADEGTPSPPPASPRNGAGSVITNVQEGVMKLFTSEGSGTINSNAATTTNLPAHQHSAAIANAGLAHANPPNDIAPSNVNMSANEKQMTSQDKSIVRHRFDDVDDRGNLLCKFQCQVYFAKQFEAVRNCYFREEDNRNYIRSLAMAARWSAQGGKSGASFSKTVDERLICKQINRVELQMFLDFAPAYFEYMAKAYYHNLPTVLCKILGVYTVRFDNRETGKKVAEHVVVMENIFYNRDITRTFDLKGSSRARYVELASDKKDYFDEAVYKRRRARRKLKERQKQVAAEEASRASMSDSANAPPPSVNPTSETASMSRNTTQAHHDPSDMTEQEIHAALQPRQRIPQVLMDDNLMEFTKGRPFPLKHRAKLFFHKAVQNDTLFLSIVNVVDYSILVGFDENRHEMTVGIIDYLRQYDIVKKMERVGKGSVGMLTGQAEPTIIQPSQYRKRFTLAMERYFMTIPDKWISYDT